MKNLRQHAVTGTPIRESCKCSDGELLDFLQRDIIKHGPLLLHDGYATCGMNRGLACVPTGLVKRDLREAIKAMMPQERAGVTARRQAAAKTPNEVYRKGY